MEWVLAKYHHRKHNSITKNTNAMQKSVIFQLIKTCYSLPKNVLSNAKICFSEQKSAIRHQRRVTGAGGTQWPDPQD